MRLLFVCVLLLLSTSCGYRLSFTPNNLVASRTEYTEGGEPVIWYPAAFPLTVIMDENLTAHQQKAVRAAVARWNREVGMAVFKEPLVVEWIHPALDHPVAGFVTFSQRPLSATSHVAEAHWTVYRNAPDRMMHVAIYFDEGRPEYLLENAAVHELGHALGLAHDRDPRSVMFVDTTERVREILPEDLEYVRFQVR